MTMLILILTGLCLGSFVNALNYRLHQQSKKPKKLPTNQPSLSIVTGRSFCPNCKHTLESKDLFPVLSWLLLRGKCRYCSKPIPDTPLPEIILPVLFIVSYVFWPLSFNAEGVTLFILWTIFLTGFLALALYDLRWFQLPDRVVFPLAGLAVLQIVLQLTFFHASLQLLITTLWGLVFGGGIFWLIFQLSSGKWIGGGDVKLGWVLGLLLGGPAMSLLMIFLASLLGTIVSIPMLVAGKASTKLHIPFGPFLLVSAVIVRLFGTSMILWYKHHAGLY